MGRRDLQLVKRPHHRSTRPVWSPFRRLRLRSEVERRERRSPRAHLLQSEHPSRRMVFLLRWWRHVDAVLFPADLVPSYQGRVSTQIRHHAPAPRPRPRPRLRHRRHPHPPPRLLRPVAPPLLPLHASRCRPDLNLHTYHRPTPPGSAPRPFTASASTTNNPLSQPRPSSRERTSRSAHR